MSSVTAGRLGVGTCASRSEWHRKALAVATRSDQRAEQARAYAGLGDVLAARGEHAAARVEWQRALDRYEDMGMAYAAGMRARLTGPG